MYKLKLLMNKFIIKFKNTCASKIEQMRIRLLLTCYKVKKNRHITFKSIPLIIHIFGFCSPRQVSTGFLAAFMLLPMVWWELKWCQKSRCPLLEIGDRRIPIIHKAGYPHAAS